MPPKEDSPPPSPHPNSAAVDTSEASPSPLPTAAAQPEGSHYTSAPVPSPFLSSQPGTLYLLLTRSLPTPAVLTRLEGAVHHPLAWTLPVAHSLDDERTALAQMLRRILKRPHLGLRLLTQPSPANSSGPLRRAVEPSLLGMRVAYQMDLQDAPLLSSSDSLWDVAWQPLGALSFTAHLPAPDQRVLSRLLNRTPPPSPAVPPATTPIAVVIPTTHAGPPATAATDAPSPFPPTEPLRQAPHSLIPDDRPSTARRRPVYFLRAYACHVCGDLTAEPWRVAGTPDGTLACECLLCAACSPSLEPAHHCPACGIAATQTQPSNDTPQPHVRFVAAISRPPADPPTLISPSFIVKPPPLDISTLLVTPDSRPLSDPLRPAVNDERMAIHSYLSTLPVTASASLCADNGKLVQFIELARRRAFSHGSSVVSPRDFAEARRALQPGRSTPHSPASELPVHYDELCRGLHLLYLDSADLVQSGHPAPRVIVLGETSGVVSSMFMLAGADVATCDLQSSEISYIPHYQGNADDVQDAGWDLVIAHPPCTFLSNAGLRWLDEEPSRLRRVAEAAEQFLRRLQAQAPFVAIENPRMHHFARDLIGGVEATQFVHPWQHGTGHTKATGLYLRGLPPLAPTCIVSGRRAAMANLPQSPERGALRSRTYVGIAAAMALQWMPVLLDYCRKTPSRHSHSAAQLFDKAHRPVTTPCYTLTPTSSTRPWESQRPRPMLSLSPPRLIHRIRSRWHMWRVVDDGPRRLYAWVPLSPTIQALLNLASSSTPPWPSPLEDEPLPVQPSASPTVPLPPHRLPPLYERSKPLDLPHRVIARIVGSTTSNLLSGIYREWARSTSPTSRRPRRLGLGATPTATGPPLLSHRTTPHQRIAFFTAMHGGWVPGGLLSEAEPVDSFSVCAVAPEEPKGVAVSEVTITPQAPIDWQCLYATDLIIGRSPPPDFENFILDPALRITRALADTGAGPSVITTGILDTLPPDACVTRDRHAYGDPVSGADGTLLRTEGYADVIFSLSGLPCRHRFLVVVGAPMLILGNDFLQPRSASIHLSDSKGGLLHHPPHITQSRSHRASSPGFNGPAPSTRLRCASLGSTSTPPSPLDVALSSYSRLQQRPRGPSDC